MIDRVTIQNYKSLKDVTVTFDSRFTVLVGANGSGKSSVLKCIHSLCEILNLTGGSGEPMGRATRAFPYTYSGTGDNQLVEISTRLGMEEYQARFYQTAARSKWPIGPQFVRGTHHALTVNKRGEKQHDIVNGEADNHLPELEWSFAKVEYVRFETEKLASPSQLSVHDRDKPLSVDGWGLASRIRRFITANQPAFQLTQSSFRSIIPNVQSIRVDDVALSDSDRLADELLFDLPNRKGVPASQMSDGTLYALGLIVKILDPQRPKTLLIDDIDHGFHPKAQTQLVELIKKLLDEFPDLQIIATSHSPYTLSGLGWDEVRVLHLRDDGTTVVRKLSDHPKFEEWHTSITPGEFWNFAGEEWADRAPAGPAR